MCVSQVSVLLFLALAAAPLPAAGRHVGPTQQEVREARRGPCPEHWTYSQHRCLRLYPAAASWTKARQSCSRLQPTADLTEYRAELTRADSDEKADLTRADSDEKADLTRADPDETAELIAALWREAVRTGAVPHPHLRSGDPTRGVWVIREGHGTLVDLTEQAPDLERTGQLTRAGREDLEKEKEEEEELKGVRRSEDHTCQVLVATRGAGLTVPGEYVSCQLRQPFVCVLDATALNEADLGIE